MRTPLFSIFLVSSFIPFSSYSQSNLEENITNGPINKMNLESLCNNNDYNACFSLAKYYLGTGKHNESAELLKKSCEGNFYPACNEIGVLLQKGEIIPRDLKHSKEYLEKSCENKNPNGCQFLVDFHNSIAKESVSSQEKHIDYHLYYVDNKFYEIGCELNVGDACTRVGENIEFSDLDSSESKIFSNFRKAIKYYDKACELNSGEGCAKLAFFNEGMGTHVKYYEKSCKLNYGGGCGSLGSIYFDGKGVEKDIFRARNLFTKGCELNDEFSCRFLGYMYKYGKGVKQSYPTAKTFIEKACSLSASECIFLADFYRDGNGVRQDYKKASELYKKACDTHFAPRSCVSLGEMYYFGQGVKKDRKKAKDLFGSACDAYDEQGCENYSKMNRGLTLY